MLAGDRQPRFGQQEVDVGDAAVKRILDRDDGAVGATVLDRGDRVVEGKARQRQCVRERLAHRLVRIGPRRALEGDGAMRFGGGRGGQRGDERGGGGGIVGHRARGVTVWARDTQCRGRVRHAARGARQCCAAALDGLRAPGPATMVRALSQGDPCLRRRTLDSFEWNKIAGWVLTAAIAVLGLILVTGEVYKPHKLAKPGYVVEGVEQEAAAGAPAPVADKPVEFFLASASVDKGADVFKKCGACHNAEKGGPAGIGPNLYGVVGGPHDHMPGFSYSDAMEKTASAKWGFDELNAWLTSPKAYVPGTKMAFAGISKPEERAAVIAYLNSKSDHPLPLPPVPADTAAAAPATVASAAATAGTPAGKTTSPAAVATSEKLAPQAGKAPDVDPATTTPAAVDTTKGGKH